MKIILQTFFLLKIMLSISTTFQSAKKRGLKSLNSLSTKNETIFTLGEKDFLLNGKPFQIISGEMHYPRIPKEAWRDRMKMARAMGLNTISIYIFWNMHQPEKNEFDFEGNNNISEFVNTAKEEGLYVILRPSPYVCAEWEFGGYPYWLQNEQNLEVRSTNANYLSIYKKYITKVAEQIAHYQINRGNGGNILMIQVENEYGSYGSDKNYLEINKRIFIEAGFDGVLFTCDPIDAIKNGHLPGLLPALNGQDDPELVKKTISENNGGKGPFLIAEWYPAWFDSWGRAHNTKDAALYAEKLDAVLKNGISINMYMFHGGTTFAYHNGANYYLYETGYDPQLTSYDYDAPLNEAGNPTDKFYKFREVIQKYLPAGSVLPDVPGAKPAVELNDISFYQKNLVLDSLAKFELFANKTPLAFEDIKLDYGFALYEAKIKLEALDEDFIFNLKFEAVRDYAIVFINKKRLAILDRRLDQDNFNFTIEQIHLHSNPDGNGEFLLQVLVENQGRINFGPELLNNRKGLLGNVWLNNQTVENWTINKITLNSLRDLSNSSVASKEKFDLKSDKALLEDSDSDSPVVLKGKFNLSKTADTYLDFSAWGKGTAWINGNNLGRFWSIGPQQTLYVPREWLREGENTIVVFEAIKNKNYVLRGVRQPILDSLNKN